MKLLLHTCCAPCSGAIVEALLNDGITPLIYYCNPNIHPYAEYLIRRDECRRYAVRCGLEMVEAEYDHDAWLRSVAGLENEPERGARCETCFRYRLLQSAQYAVANGFDTMATTLASSRWKNLNQVNGAGEWAVAAALSREDGNGAVQTPSLSWWDRNWRKGGLQERRNQIIKDMNFYNQRYCGCEFSIYPSKEQNDENK